jgi:1,4-dihydroxy-2-naphthoate octaprenyltransferase
VIIGSALAARADSFHALAASCALLAAIFIQIGTNYYNDYADFARGVDTPDRVGPLRATQAGLVAPMQMKAAAAIAFALAVVCGAYLIYRGGWVIAVIGFASIGAGYLYSATRFALAYVGLADLFVLVFFGPVAVGGTYYVQTLSMTPSVLIAGLAPGLLATAILLVNNIRDIDQDRAADKYTLVVRFGRRFGVRLYAACFVLASLVPVVLFLRNNGSAASLSAVLVLPLGLPLVRSLTATRDGEKLNETLAATARLLLLYSVVFAVGWNLGS